jgi:hypothetical protein
MNLTILCTAIGYLFDKDVGAAVGAAIGSAANLLLNVIGWPLKIT